MPPDPIPPPPALPGWPKLTTLQRTGLESLGLRQPGDLLVHFPRRHEDRRHAAAFPGEATATPVSLDATVIDTRLLRFGRAKSIFEAVLVPAHGTGGGKIIARWFNLVWMQKAISAGDRMFAFGRIKKIKDRCLMDHPEIEVMEPEDLAGAGIHTGRITPVYPLASGIKQKFLRALMHRTLADWPDEAWPPPWPDTLTPMATELLGHAPDAPAAVIRSLHFPESAETEARARRQWALAAFFRLQIGVADRRRHRAATATPHRCGRGHMLSRFADSLPYQMTSAQIRSIREIRADLKKDTPMLRLLQGDVGSGKTAVAMAAVALVAESGSQVAVMAPTQILAEQHYRVFSRHLAPLGLTIALRTAARAVDSSGTNGESRPDVVIGTHALLFDRARALLDHTGLVIIDEQHKFGVAQRARLLDLPGRPHTLVMTATPIPRTLTMTLYGDLDVSVIDELPPGRGELITVARVAPQIKKVTAFLREKLADGRQAYVVHPLVEESEKQSAKAATTAVAEWEKRLPGHTVALLTGRTPADEKDAVMERFRAGEIALLVTTTVIEVGVDVPNACIMLIEDAGRFGLAQLHQLRGRVGRGGHRSYCILLLGKDDADHAERLDILTRTRDGFAIAEEDLRIRGPGDVLGTAQSGIPALDAPTVSLLADTRLIAGARAMADHLLAIDPNLSHPDHAPWLPCLDGNAGFAHVG